MLLHPIRISDFCYLTNHFTDFNLKIIRTTTILNNPSFWAILGYISTKMKFMKLGSKPDSFQSNEDSIRYVASELVTDVVIDVENVKFYLHKFPLLSKSARLQKLISTSNEDKITINDIPGGSTAFEICAKFCYGMTVTLNAYNVVAVRCAAEYLEMYESIENGNLVYKIEVFLNSSVLRSWKDSIIVLQSTKLCNPWSEEVKIVARCLESIASKAVMEPAKVDWSFTRKNNNNGGGGVPREWWIEDLCDLDIGLYKRVISTIKSKERVSSDVIGEALEAYAIKNIFNFKIDIEEIDDICRFKSMLETLIWLLPNEKQSCSCGFLIKMLKSLISVESDKEKKELVRRIGEKLEEATVMDLLIFEIEIVETLIDEFLTQINVSEDSKAMVAKLIDGYLAEISRIDSNLSPLKFLEIAEKVSNLPRLSHDGIYRAIDLFLKEHSGVTKSEKKTICRLIDCRKLSPEACAHAVQNERLPLRVVVQILFFEQVRSTGKPSGQQSGSQGSSKANTEEECESVAAMEEKNVSSEKVKANKGIVMSKVFSKLWSKERDGVGDVSSSDTSESPGSATTVDDKSTPSTRRRRSSS